MNLVARGLSSPIPRVLVTSAQRGTAGDIVPVFFSLFVFFVWISEVVASPGNGYHIRIRTLLRGFTERFADQPEGDGEWQIIMHHASCINTKGSNPCGVLCDRS